MVISRGMARRDDLDNRQAPNLSKDLLIRNLKCGGYKNLNGFGFADRLLMGA